MKIDELKNGLFIGFDKTFQTIELVYVDDEVKLLGFISILNDLIYYNADYTNSSSIQNIEYYQIDEFLEITEYKKETEKLLAFMFNYEPNKIYIRKYKLNKLDEYENKIIKEN